MQMIKYLCQMRSLFRIFKQAVTSINTSAFIQFLGITHLLDQNVPRLLYPKCSVTEFFYRDQTHPFTFTSFPSLFLTPLHLNVRNLCVIRRAPSSASARTASLGFSARSLTPATADPAATTAPALTSGKEGKGKTSRARASQVGLCSIFIVSFSSAPLGCLFSSLLEKNHWILTGWSLLD